MAKKPDQVKDIVFKVKSLSQKIRDITIGAGAANSPYIYVIFDKEAAAQFSKATKVYLSWKHLDAGTRGYNVFTQESKSPNIWKITLPQSLLVEGAVQARLELVDEKSIAPSQNFQINVLENPNNSSDWVHSDDYTAFQEALLEVTQRVNDTIEMLESTKDTVNDLNALFKQVQELYEAIKCEELKAGKKANKALNTSYEALATAMKALNQLRWGDIK